MPYGIPEGNISINKKNSKAVALLCLMVFLCSFVVYANTLKGDFVWDDEYLVTRNPQIKNFSNLPKVFARYLGYGSGNRNNFYRPVQEISNMVDYAVWRGSPRGFHLTNTVLHSLVAVLAFILIFYLSGDLIVSGISALLFAVHPVHTEAVSYIAGRAEVLYTFFSLGAMILFIRSAGTSGKSFKRRILYLSSLALYALAILSKETAMIVPLLIFCYVFFFVRGIKSDDEYRKLRWGFLPYAAILAAYTALRLSVLDFSHLVEPSILRNVPPAFRGLTFLRSMGVYLRILVFPFDLHMERTITITKSVFEGSSIISILGAIVWGFAAIRLYSRNRLISFSIVWCVVCLFPVSNIVPINSFIAEHWIYMSSIGCFVLGGLAVSWGYKKISGEKMLYRLSYFAVVGAVLGTYAWITVSRNFEWADEESFYKSSLKYQPTSGRLYLNLGNTYYERGDIDEAIKCYMTSLKLEPDYAPAYGNIASCLIAIGDWDGAERYLVKAIRLKNQYPAAYYNLGMVYYSKGRMDSAEKQLLKATEQMPQLYQAWNLLGKVYLKMGDEREASKAFRRSIGILPDQDEILEKYKKYL
jgi:protein O-mannosyl-transferase